MPHGSPSSFVFKPADRLDNPGGSSASVQQHPTPASDAIRRCKCRRDERLPAQEGRCTRGVQGRLLNPSPARSTLIHLDAIQSVCCENRPNVLEPGKIRVLLHIANRKTLGPTINITAIGFDQSGHDLHEGGFTRSVPARQPSAKPVARIETKQGTMSFEYGIAAESHENLVYLLKGVRVA